MTAADLRCEDLLRRRLRHALPDAGFLGEERASNGLSKPLVWVVDPIDGTSNFAVGIQHWAVSVALLHEGVPVCAAIWSQLDSALFSAVAGEGARRNGRRLAIPRASWDDGSVVGCQWPCGEATPLVRVVQSDGARVRVYGSTVLQLLDVALGRLDGNVQSQGRLWDLAAASLVLKEVGALVTDWRGRPVFPGAGLDRGHHPSVVAMPHVHRVILRKLKKVRLPVPHA